MSQTTNEPKVDRPPVTADVAPVAADAEVAGRTRLGGLRIPTDALRAYTMLFALVLIWIAFHYATARETPAFLDWEASGGFFGTLKAHASYFFSFRWVREGLFLGSRNFSNLMRQAAVTGVLATGMLMVIVAGQIDLSVGSVVGLAG
jgi:ABC-type xylose transport system permease subunit